MVAGMIPLTASNVKADAIDDYEKWFISQHKEYVNSGAYIIDLNMDNNRRDGFSENLADVYSDAASDKDAKDYSVLKFINNTLGLDLDATFDESDEMGLLLGQLLIEAYSQGYGEKLYEKNFSQVTIDVLTHLLNNGSTFKELVIDETIISSLENLLDDMNNELQKNQEMNDTFKNAYSSFMGILDEIEAIDKSFNFGIAKDLGGFAVGTALDIYNAYMTSFRETIQYVIVSETYKAFSNELISYLNKFACTIEIQKIQENGATGVNLDFTLPLKFFDNDNYIFQVVGLEIALKEYINNLNTLSQSDGNAIAKTALLSGDLKSDITSESGEILLRNVCSTSIDALVCCIPIVGKIYAVIKAGLSIGQFLTELFTDHDEKEALVMNMVRSYTLSYFNIATFNYSYMIQLPKCEYDEQGYKLAKEFDLLVQMQKAICSFAADCGMNYEKICLENSILPSYIPLKYVIEGLEPIAQQKSWHNTAITLMATEKLKLSEIKCHGTYIPGTSTDEDTGINLAKFNSRLSTFRTVEYGNGSTYVDNPELTGGYECFGFANELAIYMFGSYPTNSMSAATVNSGWTRVYGGDAVDSLSIGDIVRYHNHSIFITGIDGDNIYYCQANVPAGTNKVTYDNCISRSDLKNKVSQKLTSANTDKTGWVAHFNDGLTPSQPAPEYEKDSRYPTPIKAYTLNGTTYEVYYSAEGSKTGGCISSGDECTIDAVYTNGWMKVTYPLDNGGGTKTAFVPSTEFIASGYDFSTVISDGKYDVYTRSDANKWFGYVAIEDFMIKVGKSGNYTQVIYPIADGYKMGWANLGPCTVTDSNGNVLAVQPCGTAYTLPDGTNPEGQIFFGWTIDGVFYAPGTKYELPCTTTTVVLNPYTVSKDAHVYIDQANGSDNNLGLSKAAAVKTLSAAGAVLAKFPEKATLHVVGELYDETLTLPAYNGVLTIVGTDTAGVLSANKDIGFNSDIVLKDIGLKVATNYKFINTNGYNLAVEKGTYKVEDSQPIRVHAGKMNQDTNGDMTITLNASVVEALYVGPYYNMGVAKSFNGDIVVNVGKGVTLEMLRGGDSFSNNHSTFVVNGAIIANVAKGASIKKAEFGYASAVTDGYIINNYTDGTTITNKITDEVKYYASGECGENLTWICGDTLTIFGTGKMMDCEFTNIPWRTSRAWIKNIVIADGVTSIGNKMFYDCVALTSITIPDSVLSIGDTAFGNCKSLTSITIPDGVTSIGDNVFSNCSSLTSVDIGTNVASIGENVFSYCSNLLSISVDSKNNYFSSQDGILFNKGKTILIRYPSGNTRKSYTIPGSVTTIGDRAFYACDNLTSVVIPNSITSIGDYAFSGANLTSVIIPDSVKSVGNYAFSSSSITSVDIGTGITSIGDRVFYQCDNLTKVVIPDGVTNIGIHAFSYCDNLTSIVVPASVTSIGNDAFSNCPNLTISGYEGSYVQTYANNKSIPFITLVTGVTLNKTSASITVGNTVSLTATVSPGSAANKAVTWASSNTSVATVSNGVVTAKSAGTAKITVTTKDGNKTATCTVTVKPAVINVTGITLNKTTSTMEIGKTLTLTATVSPSNATNKNVTWKSDNTAVATVVNGVVTAKSEGTANITVTTEDGKKTAVCAVTVHKNDAVSNIVGDINGDGQVTTDDLVMLRKYIAGITSDINIGNANTDTSSDGITTDDLVMLRKAIAGLVTFK